MSLKEQVLELKNRCYACKECPLGRKEVDGLDPHVFASGFMKSKIFFIAEAPGKHETVERRPLVGRAGKFFEAKILGGAGLKGLMFILQILCFVCIVILKLKQQTDIKE